MISKVEVYLNHVNDVNAFVTDMYPFSGKVDVHSENGRYRVSGNSILGMFSLDLSNPVWVIMNSDNKSEHEAFLMAVKRYEVKEC